MMAKRIKFVILGCPKNRADAEAVAGILKDAGFDIVGWDEEADAAILFTCSFVRDAEEETMNTIVELGKLKRAGKLRALLVVGCMPQRHRGEKGIADDLPEVDAWVGAADYPKLPKIIERAFGDKRHFRVPQKAGFLPGRGPRLRLGTEPYSYLKISEGCENRCAYCTIPGIKGDFRSRPMGQLLDEAEKLVDAGAKEIVLVGQDTALYGIDRYGHKRLGKLLRKMAERTPEAWVRVMYCHPAHLEDDVVETIAEFSNICPYLDIPIQHAANSVLRRMGRQGSGTEIEKLIRRIREKVPEIILRTTVMVGFPGETQAEFRELVDFVKSIRFERLGAFAYSREEGTPAYNMRGQVSERVKLDRLDIVMRMQQEISWEIHQDWEGKEMEVLVDGVSEDRPGRLTARSMAYAPEVDGEVYIPADQGFQPGDVIEVRITDALPYELEGEPLFDRETSKTR